MQNSSSEDASLPDYSFDHFNHFLSEMKVILDTIKTDGPVYDELTKDLYSQGLSVIDKYEDEIAPKFYKPLKEKITTSERIKTILATKDKTQVSLNEFKQELYPILKAKIPELEQDFDDLIKNLYTTGIEALTQIQDEIIPRIFRELKQSLKENSKFKAKWSNPTGDASKDSNQQNASFILFTEELQKLLIENRIDADNSFYQDISAKIWLDSKKGLDLLASIVNFKLNYHVKKNIETFLQRFKSQPKGLTTLFYEVLEKQLSVICQDFNEINLKMRQSFLSSIINDGLLKEGLETIKEEIAPKVYRRFEIMIMENHIFQYFVEHFALIIQLEVPHSDELEIKKGIIQEILEKFDGDFEGLYEKLTSLSSNANMPRNLLNEFENIYSNCYLKEAYSLEDFHKAERLPIREEVLLDRIRNLSSLLQENKNEVFIQELMTLMFYILKRGEGLSSLAQSSAISQKILAHILFTNSDDSLRLKLFNLLSRNSPIPLTHLIFNLDDNVVTKIFPELYWLLDPQKPVLLSYGLDDSKGKTLLLNKTFLTSFEVSQESVFFNGSIDIQLDRDRNIPRNVQIADVHGSLTKELRKFLSVVDGVIIHVNDSTLQLNKAILGNEIRQILENSNIKKIFVLIRDSNDSDTSKFKESFPQVYQAKHLEASYFFALPDFRNSAYEMEPFSQRIKQVIDNWEVVQKKENENLQSLNERYKNILETIDCHTIQSITDEVHSLREVLDLMDTENFTALIDAKNEDLSDNLAYLYKAIRALRERNIEDIKKLKDKIRKLETGDNQFINNEEEFKQNLENINRRIHLKAISFEIFLGDLISLFKPEQSSSDYQIPNDLAIDRYSFNLKINYLLDNYMFISSPDIKKMKVQRLLQSLFQYISSRYDEQQVNDELEDVLYNNDSAISLGSKDLRQVAKRGVVIYTGYLKKIISSLNGNNHSLENRIAIAQAVKYIIKSRIHPLDGELLEELVGIICTSTDPMLNKEIAYSIKYAFQKSNNIDHQFLNQIKSAIESNLDLGSDAAKILYREISKFKPVNISVRKDQGRRVTMEISISQSVFSQAQNSQQSERLVAHLNISNILGRARNNNAKLENQPTSLAGEGSDCAFYRNTYLEVKNLYDLAKNEKSIKNQDIRYLVNKLFGTKFNWWVGYASSTDIMIVEIFYRIAKKRQQLERPILDKILRKLIVCVEKDNFAIAEKISKVFDSPTSSDVKKMRVNAIKTLQELSTYNNIFKMTNLAKAIEKATEDSDLQEIAITLASDPSIDTIDHEKMFDRHLIELNELPIIQFENKLKQTESYLISLSCGSKHLDLFSVPRLSQLANLVQDSQRNVMIRSSCNLIIQNYLNHPNSSSLPLSVLKQYAQTLEESYNNEEYTTELLRVLLLNAKKSGEGLNEMSETILSTLISNIRRYNTDTNKSFTIAILSLFLKKNVIKIEDLALISSQLKNHKVIIEDDTDILQFRDHEEDDQHIPMISTLTADIILDTMSQNASVISNINPSVTENLINAIVETSPNQTRISCSSCIYAISKTHNQLKDIDCLEHLKNYLDDYTLDIKVYCASAYSFFLSDQVKANLRIKNEKLLKLSELYLLDDLIMDEFDYGKEIRVNIIEILKCLDFKIIERLEDKTFDLFNKILADGDNSTLILDILSAYLQNYPIPEQTVLSVEDALDNPDLFNMALSVLKTVIRNGQCVSEKVFKLFSDTLFDEAVNQASREEALSLLMKANRDHDINQAISKIVELEIAGSRIHNYLEHMKLQPNDSENVATEINQILKYLEVEVRLGQKISVNNFKMINELIKTSFRAFASVLYNVSNNEQHIPLDVIESLVLYFNSQDDEMGTVLSILSNLVNSNQIMPQEFCSKLVEGLDNNCLYNATIPIIKALIAKDDADIKIYVTRILSKVADYVLKKENIEEPQYAESVYMLGVMNWRCDQSVLLDFMGSLCEKGELFNKTLIEAVTMILRNNQKIISDQLFQKLMILGFKEILEGIRDSLSESNKKKSKLLRIQENTDITEVLAIFHASIGTEIPSHIINVINNIILRNFGNKQTQEQIASFLVSVPNKIIFTENLLDSIALALKNSTPLINYVKVLKDASNLGKSLSLTTIQTLFDLILYNSNKELIKEVLEAVRTQNLSDTQRKIVETQSLSMGVGIKGTQDYLQSLLEHSKIAPVPRAAFERLEIFLSKTPMKEIYVLKILRNIVKKKGEKNPQFLPQHFFRYLNTLYFSLENTDSSNKSKMIIEDIFSLSICNSERDNLYLDNDVIKVIEEAIINSNRVKLHHIQAYKIITRDKSGPRSQIVSVLAKLATNSLKEDDLRIAALESFVDKIKMMAMSESSAEKITELLQQNLRDSNSKIRKLSFRGLTHCMKNPICINNLIFAILAKINPEIKDKILSLPQNERFGLIETILSLRYIEESHFKSENQNEWGIKLMFSDLVKKVNATKEEIETINWHFLQLKRYHGQNADRVLSILIDRSDNLLLDQIPQIFELLRVASVDEALVQTSSNLIECLTAQYISRLVSEKLGYHGSDVNKLILLKKELRWTNTIIKKMIDRIDNIDQVEHLESLLQFILENKIDTRTILKILQNRHPISRNSFRRQLEISCLYSKTGPSSQSIRYLLESGWEFKELKLIIIQAKMSLSQLREVFNILFDYKINSQFFRNIQKILKDFNAGEWVFQVNQFVVNINSIRVADLKTCDQLIAELTFQNGDLRVSTDTFRNEMAKIKNLDLDSKIHTTNNKLIKDWTSEDISQWADDLKKKRKEFKTQWTMLDELLVVTKRAQILAANGPGETYDQLVQTISHLNSDLPVDINMIKNEISKIENVDLRSEIYLTEKLIRDWDNEDISNWLEKSKDLQSGFKIRQDMLIEMLTVTNRAHCIVTKHHLTDAQILTLLLMTKLQYTKLRGNLLQVATGEGKSNIVAIFAIIYALMGLKINVITSSPVLAERDAKEKAQLYNAFKLSVSHNIDKKTYIKGKKACYDSDIVYGDTAQFQFDTLRHEYSDFETLGERGYDLVLIDEVDSMLIDDSSKIARLSTEISGMHHLEKLYHLIWRELIMLDSKIVKLQNNDLYFVFGKQRRDNRGRIIVNYYNDDGNIQEVPDLENAIAYGAIDEQIAVKINEDSQEFIKQRLIEDIKEHTFGLSDPTRCRVANENKIRVPQHFINFVQLQIPKWVESAIIAKYIYQEKVHYIVSEDKNICPVDYDSTGVIQANTNWSDGLHQFLQLKHGLKITPENLTSNFLSNIGYFKNYGRNLIGLTGTLGSESTKQLLQKVYGVGTTLIPTSRDKQFQEIDAIIADDYQGWIAQICESACREVMKQKGVLVICENIGVAETINLKLQEKRMNIKAYTMNNMDQEKEIEHISARQIIIATNLAGRGTDIKTSDEIESNGGLHVILTFLPSNSRVEDQAFGRTARQGKRGTGQMILCRLDMGYLLTDNSNNMKVIKRRRDQEESRKLNQFENEELIVINNRDRLFKSFCSLLKKKRKNIKKNAYYVMSAIEERWALYLKQVDQCMNDFQRLENSYKDLEEDILANHDPDKLIKNPYYFVLIGNEYLMKNPDEALSYFDKAIELDRDIVVAAHYGRAIALISKKNNDYKIKALASLQKATKILYKEIAFINAIQALMEGNQHLTGQKLENNNLECQLTQKVNLFGMFLNSIKAIIEVITRSRRLIDINITYTEAAKQTTVSYSGCERVDQKVKELEFKESNCKVKIDLTFNHLTVIKNGAYDQAKETISDCEQSSIWTKITGNKKTNKIIELFYKNLRKEDVDKMLMECKCLCFSLQLLCLNTETLMHKLKILFQMKNPPSVNFKIFSDRNGLIQIVESILQNIREVQFINLIDLSSCPLQSEKVNIDSVKNQINDRAAYCIEILNMPLNHSRFLLVSDPSKTSFELELLDMKPNIDIINEGEALNLFFTELDKANSTRLIDYSRKHKLEFQLTFKDLGLDDAKKIIEQASVDQEDILLCEKPNSFYSMFMREDRPTIELRMLAGVGIDKLFEVNERKFVPWTSIVTVCALAALQIGVGAALQATGMGANIGTGLMAEGLADIYIACRVYQTREFTWSSYAQNKAISLVISAATMGIQVIRNGVRGASGLVQQVGVDAAQQSGTDFIKHKGQNAVSELVQNLVSFSAQNRAGITVFSRGLTYAINKIERWSLECCRTKITETIEKEVRLKFISSGLIIVVQDLAVLTALDRQTDTFMSKCKQMVHDIFKSQEEFIGPVEEIAKYLCGKIFPILSCPDSIVDIAPLVVTSLTGLYQVITLISLCINKMKEKLIVRYTEAFQKKFQTDLDIGSEKSEAIVKLLQKENMLFHNDSNCNAESIKETRKIIQNVDLAEFNQDKNGIIDIFKQLQIQASKEEYASSMIMKEVANNLTDIIIQVTHSKLSGPWSTYFVAAMTSNVFSNPENLDSKESNEIVVDQPDQEDNDDETSKLLQEYEYQRNEVNPDVAKLSVDIQQGRPVEINALPILIQENDLTETSIVKWQTSQDMEKYIQDNQSYMKEHKDKNFILFELNGSATSSVTLITNNQRVKIEGQSNDLPFKAVSMITGTSPQRLRKELANSIFANHITVQESLQARKWISQHNPKPAASLLFSDMQEEHNLRK